MPIYISSSGEWGQFVAEHSGYWLSINDQPWVKVSEGEYRHAAEHVRPWLEPEIEAGTSFETMETSTGRSIRGTTIDPYAEFSAVSREERTMADSDDRTCVTCRHWDRTWKITRGDDNPRRAQSITQYRDGEVRLLLGDWGDCQRILRLGRGGYGAPDLDNDAEVTAPAFLSDGSGYYASLATRSDFGCTLWEAGPEG